MILKFNFKDAKKKKLWSVMCTKNPSMDCANQRGHWHLKCLLIYFHIAKIYSPPPHGIAAYIAALRFRHPQSIFEEAAAQCWVAGQSHHKHPSMQKSAGVCPRSVMIGWPTYPPSIDPPVVKTLGHGGYRKFLNRNSHIFFSVGGLSAKINTLEFLKNEFIK